MWLQHGRNPNSRSYSQKKTSQDGTRENQGSKGIENPNKDQGHRKLSWICEFLQMIHPKLQLYCKDTKQAKRKEEKGMERRISMGFWQTQR